MNVTSKLVLTDFDGKNVKSFGYSRWVQRLFFIFAAYLTLPIIDFPLLGLSLSAPVFYLMAIPCILKPPTPWFHAYRHWVLLAGLIWSGILISALSNGLISGGVNINTEGINIVIHYLYWMIVFVVTVYFASQEMIIQQTAKVLGWGVAALAFLRWGEVFLYGKIGAWVNTVYQSQNDYGFLFSALSPFLLVFLLQERGAKWWLAMVANIALWSAAAINGSRGSWVAMIVGLSIALILLLRIYPRKFMGFLVGILFAGGVFVILLANPQISSAVISRFDTFQSLDTEKSYQIRQLMNQKAIQLFEESPLIGVGAARFTVSTTVLELPLVLSYASQAHFDRKSSHNSYLGFLAENGLLGAVPYAILLITLVCQGLKPTIFFIRRNKFWASAIFLGFLQMSIHMWAISSLSNTVSWFVYGLVGAMIMIEKAIIRENKMTHRRQS